MLLIQRVIDTVSSNAKFSLWLRMNFNLHTSFGDMVQRMFNALEPETKVPIARDPYSNET